MTDILPITVKASDSSLRRIIITKLIDEFPETLPNWSDKEKETLNRDCALLEPSKKLPTTLSKRADLLLSRVEKLPPILQMALTESRLPRFLTLLVVILAFVLGVVSDRLSQEGATINLLATPLLVIITWNLVQYLLLIFSIFRRLPQKVSTHSFFFNLVERFRLGHFSKGGLSSNSYRSLLADLESITVPLYKVALIRTFHWGAFSLGLGILLSIFLRGLGTSYSITWESTWLFSHPEVVQTLLTILYGWTNLLPIALAPLPDIANLTQIMQTPSAAQASDWLMRFMLLITLVILIPRFVLAMMASLRLAWRQKHATITLPVAYVNSLISSALEGKETTYFFTSNTTPSLETQALGQAMSAQSLSFSQRYASLDEEPDEDIFSAFAKGRLVLVFPFTQTPEDDVHGLWLKRLAYHQSENPLTIQTLVLVDTQRFLETFDQKSQRYRERYLLWESFLRTFSVEFGVFNFSDMNESKLFIDERFALGKIERN